MTNRQRFLKLVYPLFIWWNKLNGKNRMKKNDPVQPPVSFHSLKISLNNGTELDTGTLKGKKILVVNTASDCGYTPQYDALQELYNTYKDKLVVIGFPSNEFGRQEQGSDEEIAQFCKVNFDVSFPLAMKSCVLPGSEQNPVFQWLTKKEQNGWNEEAPDWNFTKYLVDEEGRLTHRFAPSVTPVSEEVVSALAF